MMMAGRRRYLPPVPYFSNNLLNTATPLMLCHFMSAYFGYRLIVTIDVSVHDMQERHACKVFSMTISVE